MELKQYLKETKTRQMAFCKVLGIHYQYLSKIVRKNRTPSAKLAGDIEKETGGKVTLRELLFPKNANG